MNPYFHPLIQQFNVAGMQSFGPAFASVFVLVLIAVLVWSFVWKGIALWHAARNRQLGWFIILLIVNTLGILEIIYLLFFRKDRNMPGSGTSTTVTHTTTTTTMPPMPPTPPATGGSSPA